MDRNEVDREAIRLMKGASGALQWDKLAMPARDYWRNLSRRSLATRPAS